MPLVSMNFSLFYYFKFWKSDRIRIRKIIILLIWIWANEMDPPGSGSTDLIKKFIMFKGTLS